VDDIVTVSEDEIHEAMRRLAGDPKTVAEPSGAVALAVFLFHKQELPRTKFNVVVISGGNIEAQVLAELQRDA
jgi:threonine dehydratase